MKIDSISGMLYTLAMHMSERGDVRACEDCPIIMAALEQMRALEGESVDILRKLGKLNVSAYYDELLAQYPDFSPRVVRELARRAYMQADRFLTGELQDIEDDRVDKAEFVAEYPTDCKPIRATILTGSGNVTVAVCGSAMNSDGETIEPVVVTRTRQDNLGIEL